MEHPEEIKRLSGRRLRVYRIARAISLVYLCDVYGAWTKDPFSLWMNPISGGLSDPISVGGLLVGLRLARIRAHSGDVIELTADNISSWLDDVTTTCPGYKPQRAFRRLRKGMVDTPSRRIHYTAYGLSVCLCPLRSSAIGIFIIYHRERDGQISREQYHQLRSSVENADRLTPAIFRDLRAAAL